MQNRNQICWVAFRSPSRVDQPDIYPTSQRQLNRRHTQTSISHERFEMAIKWYDTTNKQTNVQYSTLRTRHQPIYSPRLAAYWHLNLRTKVSHSIQQKGNWNEIWTTVVQVSHDGSQSWTPLPTRQKDTGEEHSLSFSKTIFHYWLYKAQAQTALFKDPVRTAL